MNRKYTCYCGLYCENCATMAKVEPAARVLYDEMKSAGFEEVVQYLEDGDAFWKFLKGAATQGCCTSCRDGGGNPGCALRLCAREKGVDMCALCCEYPCGHFEAFFEGYPILKSDNALLRDEGMEAWARLQDTRSAQGFVYTGEK